MESEYYLNGAHPRQAAGKRITAGFRILSADGAGESEGPEWTAEEPESETPAGFQIVELGRAA